MCGLIGYSCDNPEPQHASLLRALFYESRIRGLHSFGFSHWDGARVVTEKFLDIQDCVESLPIGTTRLIGHCRYSTSGDHKDMANNQPIHVGGASLAFNGVISMATKPEYEARFGRQYSTENDGEIFLDKFLRGDNWLEFVSQGRFSFAGLTLRDGRVTALRNVRRPLFRVEKNGATYFASTRDIFARAGFEEEPREVPPGKAIQID